jgi:hypothetical protein
LETSRTRWSDRLTTARYLTAALAICAIAALVLLAMGRVPICKCGYVKLWHGVVASSENSQHLTDWYTFTHVIHGFAFYGALWLVARRRPVASRFVAAVLTEAAWEVVENSSFVIDRYRAVTIALDYYGDSVVNSMADIAAMALGFVVAARARVWVIVAVTIAIEVFLAFAIRDNLTLNILMLLYPLESVRQWQMQG